MTAIAGILLDLDDTLLDDQLAVAVAFQAFVRHHGMPFDDSTRDRWSQVSRHHWARHERGELSFLEQRRARVGEFLDRTLSEDEADQAFEPHRLAYEGAWAPVEHLDAFLEATRDIRKVIVTNGRREEQARKVRALGLEPHLVGLVTPDDCDGHFKPDLRLFHRALSILELTATQCLMVGDDYVRDIEPARRLGMQVFQVKSGIVGASLLDAVTVLEARG